MAHELMQLDGLALARQPAWHGLGIVLPEDFSPHQGIIYAGADYGVDQRTIYTFDDAGNKVIVPTHMANYRRKRNPDEPTVCYGVVSAKYHIIQNFEVADFCEALLEEADGKVMCETVGTIRNGAKIWFLLKGEPFQVAKGDEMFPYILVSNGHDGSTTFRVTPTHVRAVCSNTLHATIPREDTGELGDAAICIRHTVNVMERVEEARMALKEYANRMTVEKQTIETLVKKDVNTQMIQQFFTELYTEEFGDVPAEAKGKVDENRQERCKSALASFMKRFDDEKEIAGATMWNALNAWTGTVQHDLKARGTDDLDRYRKRVESNMFGLNAERTLRAKSLAYKMAVV